MAQGVSVEWDRIHVPTLVAIFSAANVVENAVVYPLYHIKTRQQVERANVYRNTISLLREIVRVEGVSRGLYRGFWASTIAAMPSYAIYMVAYHWFKHRLAGTSPELDDGDDAAAGGAGARSWRAGAWNSLVPMASGVLADIACSTVYVPVEVVTQRLLVPNSPFSSARDAVRTVWRTEGLRGFYRGFGSTVATYGLASGVWWQVYEHAKPFLRRHTERLAAPSYALATTDGSNNTNDTSRWRLHEQLRERSIFIGAGFLSGIATSIATNPLDVVKTRMQTQYTMFPTSPAATSPPSSSSSSSSTPSPASEGAASTVRAAHVVDTHRYRNGWDGMVSIIRHEGLKGFTRGLPAKCLRNGPISAFSSIIYEQVLAWSTTE